MLAIMVQYIKILVKGVCAIVSDTKKEYVVCPDEKGSINISEDVVAAIAVSAALEVEGVGELAQSAGAHRGKKNAVRGVKLMEGSNGLFVSMPGQINSKGEIKDICFPYTREARAELESAVVTAYQQALTQGMNRSPQSAPDPTAQQAQKMGM